MKENLKRRIFRRIVSPRMALGMGVVTTGVVTAIGAGPYAIIAENNADKKAEQAFPHITSPEQLNQAQKEVLIFDSTVHNLISSGDSVVDVTKTADITKLRQAIRTIDEENVILKQRRELKQNLQGPINKRADTIVYGGVLLSVAGGIGMALQALRGKKNSTLPPESSVSA